MSFPRQFENTCRSQCTPTWDVWWSKWWDPGRCQNSKSRKPDREKPPPIANVLLQNSSIGMRLLIAQSTHRSITILITYIFTYNPTSTVGYNLFTPSAIKITHMLWYCTTSSMVCAGIPSRYASLVANCTNLNSCSPKFDIICDPHSTLTPPQNDNFRDSRIHIWNSSSRGACQNWCRIDRSDAIQSISNWRTFHGWNCMPWGCNDEIWSVD